MGNHPFAAGFSLRLDEQCYITELVLNFYQPANGGASIDLPDWFINVHHPLIHFFSHCLVAVTRSFVLYCECIDGF